MRWPTLVRALARGSNISTTRRSLLHPNLETTATPAQLPILALGFRPFFLLAGVLATLLVPLWLLALFGKITLPTRLFPATWHGHEMVFGFSVAVVAGFLLTAARNWTSRPTASGPYLFLLVLLFAAGRVVMLFGTSFSEKLAIAIDLAFLPVLAVTLAVPIVRSKNWRNLAFVPLLLLLAAANAWFHLEPSYASVALRGALDVILLMVVVMGGRVIPMFTTNALRIEMKRSGALDWASMVAMVGVAILEVAPGDMRILGAVSSFAGVLLAVRLLGWRPLATRKHPILWVLHLGWAWLAIGLVLKGIAVFVPTWISTAPLHTLAVGAIGTLILGMMSRVSLGHTGRMLIVPSSIAIAYAGLGVATILRSLGPLMLPEGYKWFLISAGVAWSTAFAIFTFVYLPILVAPRIDGKPG